MKPQGKDDSTEWPSCSFFAVYDGHGGSSCADFLRDNLHQFIIKQDCFPADPKQAIVKGFDEAEQVFLAMVEKAAEEAIRNKNQYQEEYDDDTEDDDFVDNSGSCAIVMMIIGDICYMSNVGDSRALISKDGGKVVEELSRDHKPTDEDE